MYDRHHPLCICLPSAQKMLAKHNSRHFPLSPFPAPERMLGKRVIGPATRTGILHRLQTRELEGDGRRTFTQERFLNFACLGDFDTFDPNPELLVANYMRKRSKIMELVSARNLVFALTGSGVCAAFDLEKRCRVCFLNQTEDEVVRSLFYNRSNSSLITVSVFRSDNYSTLKCRTTPFEYIRRGQPDGGFPLFSAESLRWPGFVEFDDVNGKVLTFSAEDKTYKVWDITNYQLLFSIHDPNIAEIKISPGVMLLIYNRVPGRGSLDLKLLNVQDGTVLKSFSQLLARTKQVDFIEQFNEKLLLKQEGENLRIVDVRDMSTIEIDRRDFVTPHAFIFLYENQHFLTFHHHWVSVWNFKGELATRFDDHTLWYSDHSNTNNIYITSKQDIIISYHRQSLSDRGSINVSDIITGKSLARVSADQEDKYAAALEDVTAVFYNEDSDILLTGNKAGHIHIWGK